MLAAKLLGGVGEEKLYVDDVFSAYTYTGNGSTQTINNGIDLAGKGGMVWIKDRSQNAPHSLFDTARGVGNVLSSNATNAQAAGYPYTVQSTGFTANHGQINTNAVTYASWTFRKAPKFFDVVTWVGSGVDGQTISHSLGGTPGGIIIKRTDTSSGWATNFRHTSGRYHGLLNTTDACNNGSNPAAVTMTNGYTAYLDGTSFALFAGSTGRANVNASGGTYVAYLFAHDTGTDGIIQCGSFTGNYPTGLAVTLGWEPQFVMIKSASTTSQWYMLDTSRGFVVGGNDVYLNASASNAESPGDYGYPTATGFWPLGPTNGDTYIYLAIRRPNKPPTVGTQVYNAIARTGTGAAATVTGVGFAPDLTLSQQRAAVQGSVWYDRLRGAKQYLTPTSTGAEGTNANAVTAFGMDGFSLGAEASVNGALSLIHHFFKRAPGVFDVVCYTGTGVAKTEAHNLGAVPELMIVKARNSVANWPVNIGTTTGYLELNTTQQSGTAASYWNSTTPTSSVFSLGSSSVTNGSAVTYVAYLFATKAGISKVGSYTGTGTTKQVDCGFTTGARFVVIKRTDSTGAWYVWDTVRGIIAGNDPFSLLNSTAAEDASTDYIDPYTSGFELSSTAPAAINASGGTFIYLAFA